MAALNCSTNCLFIHDGLLQSLFLNWVLNDRHRWKCEWLHFKGDDSRLAVVCSYGYTVYACVFVFLSVCTFEHQQSIIKYLSFPAGLSHCFLCSFSLSLCCEHLDFSYGGIGLFRLWSHFYPALILMNWLHKAPRQHTLSSVINAQIYSFLFIQGAVWSFFPTAEQMSPVSLGKCPPKLVSFSWCLSHANWTHWTWLSTQISHLCLTIAPLPSIAFA